jgi:hypothetical protein
VVLDDDSGSVFSVTKLSTDAGIAGCLETLISSFEIEGAARHIIGEAVWIENLELHLKGLVTRRLDLVQKWIEVNVSRFPSDNGDVRALLRQFDEGASELRQSTRMCKAECQICLLACTRSWRHEGDHDCGTSHSCIQDCEYSMDTVHKGKDVPCSLPYVCSLDLSHL